MNSKKLPLHIHTRVNLKIRKCKCKRISIKGVQGCSHDGVPRKLSASCPAGKPLKAKISVIFFLGAVLLPPVEKDVSSLMSRIVTPTECEWSMVGFEEYLTLSSCR
jgi:hypothetical protein